VAIEESDFSSSQEEIVNDTEQNERTEEEIEIHSSDEVSSQRRGRGRRERLKGKLKQDKYGRYHIRFRDNKKRVYHIEAPNNVFFNTDLSAF
jgi:hypothetical protein